jgi:hypothetical protein
VRGVGGGGGRQVSRYAEYEALSAAGNAYLEWVEVSARLVSETNAVAASAARSTGGGDGRRFHRRPAGGSQEPSSP